MAYGPMFWRIVRRSLTANYGRLLVILLALGAGAAVTSALLNLQWDASRRLTTEFRALGGNVILSPRTTGRMVGEGATMEEAVFVGLPSEYQARPVPAVAFLYVIGKVAKTGALHFEPAVIAGTEGHGLELVRPGRRIQFDSRLENDPLACEIGQKAAAQFQVQPGDSLELRAGDREASCKIFAVLTTGGPEDAQIFTRLETAQTLADLPGRISLIQLSAAGTPRDVLRFISQLAGRFPGVEVHGIKQLAEAEGRIYGRISGTLSATVLLILVLTSLSVMAGMSNVAMERKNDVGLMKAIGGSLDRVVNLFLAEAVLLGIAAGLAGSLVGLVGSIWLGKAVFGVAARPRWIVYPLSVALTVVVSIASAFPLRRLASVRPASVFRGEA